MSQSAQRSAPRRGASPFELLVDPSAYEQVAARWASRIFVSAGLGALVAAAAIQAAYPRLPGYQPIPIYALSAFVALYGLFVPSIFRRRFGVGMASAGVMSATLICAFAAFSGRTLAPSVAQGVVMCAASVPILFARRDALLIMLAALMGAGAVFLFEPGRLAPADRMLILTLQTLLYSALMVWFADTLFRLAVAERQARAETEATRAELAGVDERRRNFLDRMSHELRTPLNAIIGFSDMLRLGLAGPMTDKQMEYVADITSSGGHLVDLVNDVLDVSQIDGGSVDLALSEFSLRQAADQCVNLCREQAQRNHITIRVTSPDQLSTITADERKVKQILLNLLSNALKFTPRGGTVKVSLWRAHGSVHVQVSDTGPGVDPDDAERIFGAYEQGARNRARAGGTGLGLAVARQLAELHGGGLTLIPGPRQGATFLLILPARPVATRIAPLETNSDRDSTGVRDDPAIFEKGSVLERLAGRDGLGRYRARITAVAAITETLGAGALLLLPRPQGVQVEGWPWAGIGGVGLGLVLLHPRVRLSANQMFVLTLAAVAATGWYVHSIGPKLSSSLATFILMEGLAAFTWFRLRRALIVGAEVVIVYGLALIFEDGPPGAPVRWGLLVAMLTAGAVMARWLLNYLPALVESENRARRETERANAELAAASRHKNEFLANMSHELRTPLNAIIGFADALEQGVFGPLEPRQVEYLADIGSSGRHLLALINDILDLAKADAGRLELRARPCLLGEIIEAATTPARGRANAAGVRLAVEPDAADSTLVVDPQLIARALVCLIDNALAFTPPGGLVTVSGRSADGLAQLDVRDSGPGIDPADHERIFAAFEHAGAGTSPAGSGIGLALARQLVELHGGSVSLRSRLGAGSLFTIEVPAPLAEGDLEAAPAGRLDT